MGCREHVSLGENEVLVKFYKFSSHVNYVEEVLSWDEPRVGLVLGLHDKQHGFRKTYSVFLELIPLDRKSNLEVELSVFLKLIDDVFTVDGDGHSGFLPGCILHTG